jgi:hypothetical protein
VVVTHPILVEVLAEGIFEAAAEGIAALQRLPRKQLFPDSSGAAPDGSAVGSAALVGVAPSLAARFIDIAGGKRDDSAGEGANDVSI